MINNRSTLIGKNIHNTDPTVSSKRVMKRCYYEVMKCGVWTTQHFCSFAGYKLGPLIANCHSVILKGAGLSAGDLGFESPLCRYQLTKYPVRPNVGGVPGPCHGVCKGRLVVWLYAVLSWACVQYRWHCVSLEEKAPLGRPLVCGLKIHQKPLY